MADSEFTTETGCRVRTWASPSWFVGRKEGVYLELSVDSRRAELRLTSEEATQLAEDLTQATYLLIGRGANPE